MAYNKKPKRRKKYEGEKVVEDVLYSVMDSLHSKNEFIEFRRLKVCIDKLGKDFTNHMLPYAIKKDIIFCMTDSPVWNLQYTMLKKEILEKMNTGADNPVKDIRFKVGNFDEYSYLLTKITKQEQVPLAVDTIALSESEKQEISAAVNGLDSALKADAAKLLEFMLKHNKLKGDVSGG